MSGRHTADYPAGRTDLPLTPSPPATDLDLTLTDLSELGPLRAAVRSWLHQQAVATAAIDDVVVAVTEVAANGLVHGAAPVRVHAWRHVRTLVVQVDDAGGRPLPAAAGHLPPDPGEASGRGLWLARQLADVVTTHTGGGTTSVRLQFPHDVTHRGPAQ